MIKEIGQNIYLADIKAQKRFLPGWTFISYTILQNGKKVCINFKIYVKDVQRSFKLIYSTHFRTVTKKYQKRVTVREFVTAREQLIFLGPFHFLHYFPALLTIVTLFVVFCSIFICFKLFFVNKNGYL